MKKILCLGLVAALSFGTIPYISVAAESKPILAPYVQPGKLIIKPTVKISTKKIEEKQEAYEVDLQIPVLEGLQDKEIEDFINTFLEKDALSFAEDLKNEALQFAKDAKKQGWEIKPYTASTSYEVTYNKNNLVSIVAIYGSYTGGNHGNPRIKTFNFNLTTGKQLDLKDIFDKNENYITIINEEIKNQIKLEPTKYYKDSNESFNTIMPDNSFGIEEGNVIIYFNPYDIAPYSSGAPKFKVPFSLFKAVVKTEIQVKPDSVKVIPSLISEKNEALTCDIKLPVVKGMKDEKIQNEINKAFEKKALELKEKMSKEGKEALEDAKKYDYKARPYGIFTDYDISYNEKSIISITNSYYQYTGGAHGTTLTETSNINLKTGEKIALKDIFKDGVDYKKTITEEIQRQMAKDTRFYEDAWEGLETISENQSFYITEDGIVIYYQPYDIAPYAVGAPEFKIPLSLLKDSFRLDIIQ